MRRVWSVAGALAAMLIMVPAAVAEPASRDYGPYEPEARTATASKPRLLVGMWSTKFAVRPKRIVTTGDGSSFLGLLEGRGGAIRWSSWTKKGAKGVGTWWANDGDPFMAAGTLHPHRATVQATRVVKGRYTRLTIRFRGGESVWDAGDILWVFRYRLRSEGDLGYAWGG